MAYAHKRTAQCTIHKLFAHLNFRSRIRIHVTIQIEYGVVVVVFANIRILTHWLKSLSLSLSHSHWLCYLTAIGVWIRWLESGQTSQALNTYKSCTVSFSKTNGFVSFCSFARTLEVVVVVCSIRTCCSSSSADCRGGRCRRRHFCCYWQLAVAIACSKIRMYSNTIKRK